MKVGIVLRVGFERILLADVAAGAACRVDRFPRTVFS